MSLADRLVALDRFQRSRRFKLSALGLIALVALGSFIALWVAANEPGAAERIARRTVERAAAHKDKTFAQLGPLETSGAAIDWLLVTMNPIGRQPAGPDEPGAPGDGATGSGASEDGSTLGGSARVAVVFVVVGGAAAAVVWLGLGLTYLALLGLAWGVAWPMMLWGATAGLGQVLFAAAPLALAFLTGTELVRLALSAPVPLLAIARNVVNEAVRMKISLVFIVILILLLAYVPGALNPEQPLRYRIQQWMQYGIGLSYALLALLTLFLAAGTVAFEQRDRVIWQTMTKPVPAWQYLVGKWLGVMALNGVLLGVTASGVAMLTEFLRRQPAQGEIAYHVREDGMVTRLRPDLQTEDRRLLESQVLVARVGAFPSPFRLTPERIERFVDVRMRERAEQDSSPQDLAAQRERLRGEIVTEWDERLSAAVQERVSEIASRDPVFRDGPDVRRRIEGEIIEEWESRYRSVAPGSAKVYFFDGLEGALARPGAQLTLRYKVNAGSNDPAQVYRIGFLINDEPFERQVALKAAQTLLFDASLVRPDGTIDLVVANGPNPREISFEPDGLEILYAAGGYEANFVRIVLVLWLKLGFIAAVAIAASTFLSFPVACLVALAVLWMAESAGFLRDSLENYTSMTNEGLDYVAVVVRGIALPVAWTFGRYADLKPTANLVDGRLVGWGGLLSAGGVLLSWIGAVLGVALGVFKNRELAMYSGK